MWSIKKCVLASAILVMLPTSAFADNNMAACAKGVFTSSGASAEVTAEAIAICTLAIDEKPRPSLYQLRALLYNKEGQIDLAIADMEEAVATEEIPLSLFNNRVFLALLYAKDGRHADAADSYTEAFKLQDRYEAEQSGSHPLASTEHYLARGQAYANSGQTDLAIADFETVIAPDTYARFDAESDREHAKEELRKLGVEVD